MDVEAYAMERAFSLIQSQLSLDEDGTVAASNIAPAADGAAVVVLI